MTRWRAALCALAVVAGACSGGDETASTTTTRAATTTSATAPDRPTSTTTTMFDPASVEGQVEAAYLKSWDVYADAVYHLHLDEAALAEVYGDPLLTVLMKEIRDRITDRRAALVRVEHQYQTNITGSDTAVVIDSYVNHQVLIDSETKQPTEPDPDEQITDAFTLRRVSGRWMVIDQQRLS